MVGYKPTPGLWPSDGVAPISHVLDAIGLLARNVEDCELLDAVLTGGTVSVSDGSGDLKDVGFAYAPRQHLLDVDEQTHGIFRENRARSGGSRVPPFGARPIPMPWRELERSRQRAAQDGALSRCRR